MQNLTPLKYAEKENPQIVYPCIFVPLVDLRFSETAVIISTLGFFARICVFVDGIDAEMTSMLNAMPNM